MSKALVQVVAPFIGVALALWCVSVLGQHSRNYLQDQDRYRIAFQDIACSAPDGMAREEFLNEVQYLASWPDDVRLLEDGVVARLGRAFASHPWVEEVRCVEITTGRQVRVELAFRTPILTVPTRDKDEGPQRAVRYRGVDAHGVLLPRPDADAALKPPFLGEVPYPSSRAGAVWDDARVQAAVRTAAYLQPYAEQLGIERYEFTGEDLIVQARTGRVVWGRAPGDERANEASAEVKLQHLLDADAAKPARRDRDLRSLPETDTRMVKSK
jgi:hypothetical protein